VDDSDASSSTIPLDVPCHKPPPLNPSVVLEKMNLKHPDVVQEVILPFMFGNEAETSSPTLIGDVEVTTFV